MPAVTRSMASRNRAAKMAVNDCDTEPATEISSKPRPKTRKRKRANTSTCATNEKPKKRRRVQRNRAKSKSKTEEKDTDEIMNDADDPVDDAGADGQTNPIKAVSKTGRTKAVAVNDEEEKEMSEEELDRIRAMQAMERRLYDENDFKYVIGTDEAGRGPIAGPVVAAACYIPLDVRIAQLTDSKQLSEEQREEIFDRLTQNERVVYGVSIISHTKIDEINILQAALLGMRESSVQVNKKLLEASTGEPVDYILVDGNRDPKFELCESDGLRVQSETVVKGDSKVYCIAAASIIAKVTRDRLMVEYDKKFPLYNFSQHKGYPTPQHKALVREHGPCEIHRRSFQPVKSIVGWTRPKKSGRGQEDGKEKEGCQNKD